MTTAQQLLDLAYTFAGLPYVMGAEADLNPDGPQPSALDCSELTQVVCSRLGISMPDGHWNQWRLCKSAGTLISVEDAINTPGALLFFYDGTTEGHVAFSRGDGTTFEARGRDWGVGSWSARRNFFNYGALVPGVLYPVPNFQPEHQPTEEDPFMALTDEDIERLGASIGRHTAKFIMDEPVLLADGIERPLRNVIGFSNNIGNDTVAALHEVDADLDRAEAREAAEDAATRQAFSPPSGGI